MADASLAGRSPLELGVLTTLATLGFAAVVGVIAVIDADNVASSFGTGFGLAFLVFLASGMIACALACLARRRSELVALGSIAAAGLAVDMIILAIWLDIDNEAYGKVAGIAFVWSFFALIVLGLTLAVGTPRDLARLLYLGTVTAAVAGALISTWLIATTGDLDAPDPTGLVPSSTVGDDELLRALGVTLVLMATLWFGTLAANRLERAQVEPTG
jgi:hypothetical protein